MRKWLFPRGKYDQDKDVSYAATAIREAFEEAGVIGVNTRKLTEARTTKYIFYYFELQVIFMMNEWPEMKRERTWVNYAEALENLESPDKFDMKDALKLSSLSQPPNKELIKQEVEEQQSQENEGPGFELSWKTLSKMDFSLDTGSINIATEGQTMIDSYRIFLHWKEERWQLVATGNVAEEANSGTFDISLIKVCHSSTLLPPGIQFQW